MELTYPLTVSTVMIAVCMRGSRYEKDSNVKWSDVKDDVERLTRIEMIFLLFLFLWEIVQLSVDRHAGVGSARASRGVEAGHRGVGMGWGVRAGRREVIVGGAGQEGISTMTGQFRGKGDRPHLLI